MDYLNLHRFIFEQWRLTSNPNVCTIKIPWVDRSHITKFIEEFNAKWGMYIAIQGDEISERYGTIHIFYSPSKEYERYLKEGTMPVLLTENIIHARPATKKPEWVLDVNTINNLPPLAVKAIVQSIDFSRFNAAELTAIVEYIEGVKK